MLGIIVAPPQRSFTGATPGALPTLNTSAAASSSNLVHTLDKSGPIKLIVPTAKPEHPTAVPTSHHFRTALLIVPE